MGSARLRQVFSRAARSAKQHNEPLARFAQRLQDKGKKPKVVNSAVARKLVYQIYAMDKYQRPYDPNDQNLQLAGGTT